MQRILNEGHELGNHMVRDTPSFRLEQAEFQRRFLECHDFLQEVYEEHDSVQPILRDDSEQIEEDDDNMEDTVGRKRNLWFRPASGWFRDRMLTFVEGYGYQTVLGSCYPHDPQIRWVWLNYWRIRLMLRDGDIIILHDRAWTVPLLEKLLPWMVEAGFDCCSLSEALERRGSA